LKNKIHHSKLKNACLIFETLIRQITADILDETKNSSKAMDLIKKYFHKDTELRKELQLYQQLTKKRFVNESRASSFIDIIVQARKQLNNSKLRSDKYNIIKEINENFSVDKLFSSKIDNYSVLASIYKLFEYSDILNEVSNPEELIKAKFTVVEYMIKGTVPKVKQDSLLIELNKQDTATKLLTQELIISKFNQKYSDKLNSSQKTLIKDYIHNVSNSKTMSEVLNKHINKILTEILVLTKKIPDDAIKIKVNQVGKELKNILNKKIIKDNHIIAVLKSYNLLSEIKSHLKKYGCKKGK